MTKKDESHRNIKKIHHHMIPLVGHIGLNKILLCLIIKEKHMANSHKEIIGDWYPEIRMKLPVSFKRPLQTLMKQPHTQWEIQHTEGRSDIYALDKQFNLQKSHKIRNHQWDGTSNNGSKDLIKRFIPSLKKEQNDQNHFIDNSN